MDFDDFDYDMYRVDRFEAEYGFVPDRDTLDFEEEYGYLPDLDDDRDCAALAILRYDPSDDFDF